MDTARQYSLPQRLAKTNIVPAFWSSRAGKEGVKEKERDPLLNHQLSPLRSHNGVSQVSFSEAAVYGLGGPQQVRSVQDLGLWLDLTRPPALHWATATTERDPICHAPYIRSLVEAFGKSRFQHSPLNSLL